MSELIKLACWRAGSDYASRTSEALAAALVAPCALRPLGLLGLFQAAVAGGADAAELGGLYRFDRFIDHTEAVLASGDLAGVQALVAMAESLGGLSPATMKAIGAVIAAQTLRLVDVVAAELGVAAPATVSAAEVDEALQRMPSANG